jgi:hypothetical protein
MKKSFFTILLVVVFVLSIGAQSPPQKQSKEDIEKNLALVDKPQAVPDSMKAGFETITADNTMALLTFISSDLLGGRDTASQGYKIAAEYAASLFKLWGIKPAGDMPAPRGRFRSIMRGAGGATKPKRTYLQEIVFRETSDVSGTIKLDTRFRRLRDHRERGKVGRL